MVVMAWALSEPTFGLIQEGMSFSSTLEMSTFSLMFLFKVHPLACSFNTSPMIPHLKLTTPYKIRIRVVFLFSTQE
jgi:hypothetical protein